MTTPPRSTRVLPTNELLASADQLLNPSDDTALSPGVRARAAATLLRLALDETLDAFWRSVSPRMTRSTGRTRMLCLQWYVTPPSHASGTPSGPASAPPVTTTRTTCLRPPPRYGPGTRT